RYGFYRAFLYTGFLTDEECNHLISLVSPHYLIFISGDKILLGKIQFGPSISHQFHIWLHKSMVTDSDTGESVESDIRTSSGMFLMKAQDEIISGIEERIAAWTFLPIENGEAMQILHYENGQKYEPHFDYFHDKANQKLGGHRVATVLMYLSNVDKGGETVFPYSQVIKFYPFIILQKTHKLRGMTGLSVQKKVMQGDALLSFGLHPNNSYSVSCLLIWLFFIFVVVKPRKGDALLFFGLHPNATTDPSSLHGSCPVIEGEKWSATKWIHVRSFDIPPRRRDLGCIDENPNCSDWALSGECEKNPLYMVGTEVDWGFCRKSCKVCSS
ncbi:PREDICTED: probable prolyl 4-hydroxylase 6, partial [Erythranthe guttata]|uniref:probable prolyl 4-hydroxylase 6 n=1 Tax=Erythranthe guttata TaxID=4155 RepID=UPI00064E01AD